MYNEQQKSFLRSQHEKTVRTFSLMEMTLMKTRSFLFILPVLVSVSFVHTQPVLHETTLITWQTAPIPTGYERTFLDTIASVLLRKQKKSPFTLSYDRTGNLIVSNAREGTSPDISIMCFVDEPTFILSAFRENGYGGVRPLFFRSLTPEFLSNWVGQPLWIITSKGEMVPATFSIPSTHLHRGRKNGFWQNLSEDLLYLDFGQTEKERGPVHLFDRVVRNRSFEHFKSKWWVGYDLAPRMACMSLYILAQSILNTNPHMKLHLVFLTQSQFGQRGLQHYLMSYTPDFILLLNTTSQASSHTLHLYGKRPGPTIRRWLKQKVGLDTLEPETPLPYRDLFGRLTYVSPTLRSKIQNLSFMSYNLAYKKVTEYVHAIRSEENDTISLQTYIRRLVQWFK